MGQERWFRGQHDGQNRPFDWLTAARQQGIPEKVARALYERALQQAHGAAPGRVQELYLALLAEAHRDASRPSPGKVTRTMRLAAAQAGQTRRSTRVSRLTGQHVAPGKHTLTSYIEPPVRNTRDQDQVRAGSSPLAAMAEVFATGRLTDPSSAAMAAIDRDIATSLGFLEMDQISEGEPAHVAMDDAMFEEQPTEVEERDGHQLDAPQPLAAVASADFLGRMARAFDQRFEHVRIHRDGRLPAGRQAATRGHDIYLGPDAAPDSPDGERILAHELAHVAQRDMPATPWQARPPSITALEADAHQAALHALAGQAAAVRLAAPAALALNYTDAPGPVGAPPVGEPSGATEADGRSAGSAASEDTEDDVAAIVAQLGPGKPLDSGVAARIGDAYGADLGQVRVHTDATAARLASEQSASAFTVGAHIAFGEGVYRPDEPQGMAILAHELAHAVQQRDATPRRKGKRTPGQAHERDADRAATGVLARLWGGARRIAGAIGARVRPALTADFALQRCDTRELEQPLSAEQLATYRALLQGAITTSPEVDASRPALVGMRVTFGLDASVVPLGLHGVVRGVQWEMDTPSRQRDWQGLATRPTTTLPIVEPGAHVFRAILRLTNGQELAVEHSFQAEQPAQRASAALAGTQDDSFQQYRSQLELQHTMMRPPSAAEQAMGAGLHIQTRAANPARVAHGQRLTFSVSNAGASAGTRYHWYVRPLRWDGMPEALGGHARTTTDDGIEAYDFGTGRSVALPAEHANFYVVLCRATENGGPAGEARYLQSVFTGEQTEELARFEEYLARVDDMAGRFAGNPVALTGVHVTTRTAAETRLRLYAGRSRADRQTILLLDMTPGLDPEQHELEYDGATGAEALEELQSDNKYPEGVISLRIPRNDLGLPEGPRQFETTGESLLGRMSSWAGIASLVLGGLAIVAAPFTGGGSLLVTTLIIGSAGAGIAAGALSLANNLATEDISETAVTLDVLSIVTSFLNAGLALTAMRSSPAMLVATRGGRMLLWSNFAAEGVSGLLVTVEGAEQIARIVENDGMTPQEKTNALVRVISSMIVTSALIAISYGEMRTARDRLRVVLGDVEDQLGDPSRVTLSLLDNDTLQGLRGASAGEATRLAVMLREDPGLVVRLTGRRDHLLPALRRAAGNGAAELELAFLTLRLEGQGVDAGRIGRLTGSLRVANLEARQLFHLGDDALMRLADPVVLGEIEAIARLQTSGRVAGLGNWIQFSANKVGHDFDNAVGELREARRLVDEHPGSVVNVGGDARPPTRLWRWDEPLPTFDITTATSAGTVQRSVEVTTVVSPVSNPDDLTRAVRHGTDKLRARQQARRPIPGEHALTIRVELDLRPRRKSGGTLQLQPDGDIVQTTGNGQRRPRGNLFENIQSHLPSIQDTELLDRVTLVDKGTGRVIAEFERRGATWHRVR